MTSRRRCLPAALLALISIAPAQSERAQALEVGSRVPTCDARVQRRLEKGFAALRAGKPREALRDLLPSMRASGERPQLRWGRRETRDFFAVLRSELATLDAATRERFAAALKADAERALRSARLETGARRAARLRAILRAFPGTSSAREARLELVDLALERGDALDASFHLTLVAPAEREKRRDALAALEAHGGDEPWPNTGGAASGLAQPSRTPPSVPERAPKLLGAWPQRATWRPARARGVVGLLEGEHAIAVFQDPAQLLAVLDIPGARRFARVDLQAMTGLPPDGESLPHPAMLGARVFLGHGGVPPGRVLRGAELVPAGELFALDFTRLGHALTWRFRPRSFPAFGTSATVLPPRLRAGRARLRPRRGARGPPHAARARVRPGR